MAARTRKTELDEQWRSRLQTSMLLNRLQDHGLGKNEMTSTQIRAAEVVLKKAVPDLSSVDMSGTIAHTLDLGVLLGK